MATYFINASPNYTNKVYPYNNYVLGAESFSALLEDPMVNLSDGDKILIYFPIVSQDDSARIEEFTIKESDISSPIIIDKKILIDHWLGSDLPPVVKPVIHTPNSCPVFRFGAYGSNSTIRHVTFFRDTMLSGPTIDIRSSFRVTIDSCDFESDKNSEVNPDDGFSMWIYMYKSMLSVVRGCCFKAPANDGVLYGNYSASCIFLDTCNEVDIRTNKFTMGYDDVIDSMWGGVCKAITCTKSFNVRIKRNIITDPLNLHKSIPSTGEYFGLIDVTDCDIIDIAFNCIYGVCDGFCGIRVANNSVTMTNQYIRNNTAILSNSKPTAFICVRGNASVNMQIINNTISNEYTPDQTSVNTKAVVFDVRLNKNTSVIDYNNIWGFSDENEIKFNMNPENINVVGSHTQRFYPNINAVKCIDNDGICVINRSDLADYIALSGDSNTVGFGTEFTDIGSDYRSVQYFDAPLEYGQFCSVVDTLIASDSSIAKIATETKYLSGTNDVGTYMYNAMTTTSADAPKGLFNNIITDDVYGNQFGWQYTDEHDFPFAPGSDFIGKNSLYILMNRDKLFPFVGIQCPPNPGIGRKDSYPQYETGLFGYYRMSWDNGCCSFCVIQDTYEDVKTAWQKNINEKTVYVDNWQHLPCEDR